MNKKLNKLVTNYPVALNEEEIENLSATLAPVIAACGGGGGTGGKIYTGTGFVNVNNTTNQIGLTEDANDKLNKEYVEYNEYSTAIANRYTKTQTNALLNEKQDTLEFEYDENNKVSAINGSALAGQGGTTYTAGTDIIIDEYNIKVNTNGSANSTGMAFVEGSANNASGIASHAEGNGNNVYSDYSHIEGYNNTDYKIDGLVGANHTEGAYNHTSGVYSHNEGHANEITGYGVHVEGGYNKFYINNVSADTTHSDKTNRWNVWGISIEGMANATTAEPTSGSIDSSDYGYIHGGILKVIGNGTRRLENPSDPTSEVINRSDALIIYRDGSISAAGNISANGIELGAGGGTTYQGRNGVNVDGGYVELTQTAYESVTSIPNISNDVETLKTASGDWNKVSDKLDTTAFSDVSGNFLTAHQSLNEYATKVYANNASANALSEAETWVENQHYLSAVPDEYALKTDIPTTVAQLTDSGNYYTKSQTSGATELSTEFAKYVTSSDITTQDTNYVMTTTGWKVLTLPGGGMTQVIHDETLTGQGNDDNSKLGVAWSALSGNTINSALSAGSATSALSAKDALSSRYSKQLQDASKTIQISDITALQNWASSNSSTWNEVSAKLTTAQYATDSATFVTSGEEISGNKQYTLTTAGWEAIPIEFDLSGRNFAVGVENEFDSNGGGNDILLQGYQNSGTYVDFAQGIHNSAYQYAISQGYQNKAKYESMAQGYINTANNVALAQGSTNSADYQAFAQGILNKASYDSLAQGHSNSAVDQSIAQGLENTAYHYSFAQGYHNVADMQSFAQGADNRASYYSQTIGHNLIASGFDEDDYYYGLFAIGGYNATTSNALFVVGNGSSYNGTPTRSDAFVIYKDGSVSAKGDISANGVKLGAGGGSLTLPVNVGTGNDVSQTSAIGAIGNNCSAGTKSFAFSYKGATAYENSFVVNDDNIAGHNSFAWGWGSTADAYSMAGGNNVSAYNHSFVLAQGDSTAKSQANNYSIAFGNAVTANNWSYVFGRGLNFSGSDNATSGIGALVVGGWNNTTADAIFVLANGTSNNSRNDAMVVYRNGSVNIGNTNTIDGNNFYVEGYHNNATSAGATSQGYGYTHIEGGYNTTHGGQYNHIEGEANEVYGDRIHIQGSRNIFSAGAGGNTWGISIEGALNATTANVTEHSGLLKVIGNGVYTDSTHTTRSDALRLYRDGSLWIQGAITSNGGTFTNETIFSATTGTFDNSYIKCINNHSDGYYARYGVGSYGGAVIKVGDTNGTSPIQVNIKPTSNNYELVKIERNNSTVGYLIPAVTSTTTAGLTDDGILHIIIES